MEGRPGKRGIFSSSNSYVHLKTTVFASQAWGVKQHMVICIKPNCCYLPSLETEQGTSGLESPLWIFVAPTKCYLAQEGNKMPRWGGETQHMYKPWSSDPSSIWSPSSFSLSSLGRQILRECWYPRWSQEMCLRWCGTSPAAPHWPSMNKRKNKSTGKEGRQVLLNGSLVSMATGSALLQLLTPQSLCHPIFSWEIKEKGKVVEVWGGESWETFLGIAERRLTRMQLCLAFNHKLNPLCEGFLWDSSDLMHSQILHLPHCKKGSPAIPS